MKLVVAMSGGVDSSVAAAKLVAEGHEVIGLMLRLWAEPDCRDNRCCAPESVEQARAVANQLGIPFYLLDYKKKFWDAVVEPFAQTYLAGETPNPCLTCNKKIRFGALLDEARALGGQKLVTGHYVRLEENAGQYLLKKGLDPLKDQSYVLYQLSQAQLAGCMFPLGALEKSQTRALAKEYKLEVASKPDSQDLCFVGSGGYRGFLERIHGGAWQVGDFVDSQGKILGRHRGLPFYTVGQRRGLGISSDQPLYVTRLDVKQNQVVLGGGEARYSTWISLKEMHFQQDPTAYLGHPIAARIRYNAPENPALLTKGQQGEFRLDFLKPVLDATPGQGAVFYDQDLVIGGGIIKEVGR